MKLLPCKYLDHEPGKYAGCRLRSAAPHYPNVQYWERGEAWTDDGKNPRNVQFCGQGRGRINGIFQCYNGEMPCYVSGVEQEGEGDG